MLRGSSYCSVDTLKIQTLSLRCETGIRRYGRYRNKKTQGEQPLGLSFAKLDLT